MLELTGGLYVVAGAGGAGIGTESCVRIAQAGGHVLAIDRTELGCEIARGALGGDEEKHRVAHVDLEDETALQAALDDAQARLGPVRGLVNIVGGIPGRDLIAPLLDGAGIENFERLMRLNLRPGLTASRVVARAMIAQGEGGSIVNTTSAAGHISMAYAAGYGAAKAALMNLTRTMAVEWGRHGIRVNAVSPGTIRTEKVGRDQLGGAPESGDDGKGVIPLGRRGTPDEVSDVTLFFLSDLSRYVTGQILNVDGGATARQPYDDEHNISMFITDPAVRKRIIRSE